MPEFFATPADRRAEIAGRELSLETRFSRTLLYLHLSRRFTPAHRELFSAYLDRPRPSAWSGNAAYEWRSLVAEAGGSTDYVERSKYFTREFTRNGIRFRESRYIANCQDDAFVTAIATFSDRSQRYGRDSAAFRRWLAAQQQVFVNCSAAQPSMPAAPEDDWGLLERQDREYQIAASAFYAMDYTGAAERFRAIAADPASPWSDLARYLVARSLVRAAETGAGDAGDKLSTALDLYRGMAADPDYLARFPSVNGLIRYLEIKLDPPGFMREVASELLDRPTSVDAAALDDFLFLTEHGVYDSREDGDDEAQLLRWHRLAATGAAAEIVAEWRATRNPAWLYLALAASTDDLAVIDSLATDVASLDESAPGRTDMRLMVAELLARAREAERAQTMARAMLEEDRPVLEPGQRNRLKYLIASASRDPIEYLRLARLEPVAMRNGDGGLVAPDAVRLRQMTRGGALLPDEAVDRLNRAYTAGQLLDAVDRIDLNDYLRGRFVIAAWVRAVLVDDVESARRAAEKLKAEMPEIALQLEQFLAGDDSEFVAARILLMHPGFSPFVPPGIGRYRDASNRPSFVSTRVALGVRSYNWWCDESPLAPGFTRRFGPVVLEHARAQPDDPIVPQTLHRLVFATRYACDSGPGEISRAAFDLLHGRYPDSEWTRATPYWFD